MALRSDPTVSTTFWLVLPAWAILLGKFCFGGLLIAGYQMPYIDPTEFASAFALIVGIWVAREAKEAWRLK